MSGAADTDEGDLLVALPRSAARTLLGAGEVHPLPPGATLGGLHWGEDAVYVRSGQARLERPAARHHRTLGEARAGDLVLPFGPDAAPRVVTDDGAELVRVPAALLEVARRRFPAFDRRVARAAERAPVLWLLAGCSLFDPLTSSERQRLADRAIHRRLGMGESLVRRGECPDGLYMVLDGQVDVRGGTPPVAPLGPGGCLGVMHCLGQEASPVDAVAQGGAAACFFDAAALFSLLFEAGVWAAFERAALAGHVLATA
jgi:CRP-like cAMP-binding protein